MASVTKEAGFCFLIIQFNQSNSASVFYMLDSGSDVCGSLRRILVSSPHGAGHQCSFCWLLYLFIHSLSSSRHLIHLGYLLSSFLPSLCFLFCLSPVYNSFIRSFICQTQMCARLFTKYGIGLGSKESLTFGNGMLIIHLARIWPLQNTPIGLTHKMCF